MATLAEKIIKPKIGLLELAKQLGNVSKACDVMGYSRDTFYRFKELYDKGGEVALMDVCRKKPIVKNRVPDHVEQAVLKIATDQPALGQYRVANELQQQGIMVSGSGIRSIWIRHDLQTFKKRLKALEALVAKEGIILTEEQLQALEHSRRAKEAHGEIESEHPGYLGSQDTYYVGHIKGIGRIYQQTFVDTYCRVAMAKLYTEKTSITAADMLNSTVIPFFESQDIPLLRILTDRGSEFCGRAEHHAYQLYLAIEDIDHSRTKAYSPQTNGICERFHKTMKNEFYDVVFRKKLYRTLEELQTDVNEWLQKYNQFRPHSGKYCYGKTPMQTLSESKALVRERNISMPWTLSDSASPLAASVR
jgi:transposase InsO family protein